MTVIAVVRAAIEADHDHTCQQKRSELSFSSHCQSPSGGMQNECGHMLGGQKNLVGGSLLQRARCNAVV